MIEKSVKIATGNKTLASYVSIPVSVREKFKGMYGRTVKNKFAMLFIFKHHSWQVFDMLSIKQALGYVALNEDKIVVGCGVMRPWIGGWIGKCKYFIELPPDVVKNSGIKKGYRVSMSGL
jgi:uncharacterized membrane protein (UPF0127 family)